MKLLKAIAVGVALSLSLVARAATDPTGIFTVQWPGAGNLGDYLRVQYTSAGANHGLPSIVTNTAAVSATNVITPIIQGSDLAIQYNYSNTNAAGTSNTVWRFVASADGGRNYTTEPLFVWSTAQQNSNTITIQIIGNTNFAGITHLKLLTISNTMTVDSGAVFPASVTFNQKRLGVKSN